MFFSLHLSHPHYEIKFWMNKDHVSFTKGGLILILETFSRPSWDQSTYSGFHNSQHFFAKISEISRIIWWWAYIWLNIYGRQAIWCKLKNRLKMLVWACIRQPEDLIGWARLMPFASIYPTNLWNFGEKNIETWGSWKC